MQILIVVISQLLFTSSDLLARHNMHQSGFKVSSFISSWFVTYALIRTVATFGQLYIFSSLEVGKTMALFGATSLILVNVLGLLILKEQLSLLSYFGITLAVLAVLIISISKN